MKQRSLLFSPRLMPSRGGPASDWRLGRTLLILFLAVSPAWAQLVVEQDDSASIRSNTSITATFATAPTEDNLLVAVLSTRATSATNPSGWTTAIDVVNSPNNDLLRIAYKVAGASESATVTFTLSAADQSALGIFEVSGTATSSPLDQTASTGRTLNTTSVSSGTTSTTTQADEILFVGYYMRELITSPSLDNSFTLVHHEATTGGQDITVVDGHRIVSATGAYESTASWTTNVTAMGAIATFKAASGAARRLMVISANHPSEHPVAVQPSCPYGYERLHRERAGGRKWANTSKTAKMVISDYPGC